MVPNIRPEATGPLLETTPLHPQTVLGNYSTLGPARHYGACIAPAQDSIRFVVSSLTVLPSYLGLVHAETRSEPSRHFKPAGPSQFPISQHHLSSSLCFPSTIHSFVLKFLRQPSGRLLVQRFILAVHHGCYRANVSLFSGRQSCLCISIMASPGH